MRGRAENRDVVPFEVSIFAVRRSVSDAESSTFNTTTFNTTTFSRTGRSTDKPRVGAVSRADERVRHGVRLCPAGKSGCRLRARRALRRASPKPSA